jgi:peptide/nickel transport system permease protein
LFQAVLHKLGYSFLTLFGVISIIFFLFNVLPGDPARMMLDQREDSEQLLTIKKKYAFDRPILAQYFLYLNDVSPISYHSTHKDAYTYDKAEKYQSSVKVGGTKSFSILLKVPYLRESFQKNGKKVTEVIAETFPNTFVLAVSSIVIAIIFGIFLGIVSALVKDSLLDRFIALISTLGMSIPSFFAAVLFAWLFGFVLHEFTGLNMSGSLYEVDDFGEKIYIQWKNLLLPSIVLGIRPLAVVVQLTRNSLLEVLTQDYIRTARAKGLSTHQIIKTHALKNALNPVVTAVSGWFASLLAGAVFVEYIFNWNGLGKEIVEALNTLDLPIIMGSVVLIATMFIIINIFVDVIYTWLDPKLRD